MEVLGYRLELQRTRESEGAAQCLPPRTREDILEEEPQIWTCKRGTETFRKRQWIPAEVEKQAAEKVQADRAHRRSITPTPSPDLSQLLDASPRAPVPQPFLLVVSTSFELQHPEGPAPCPVLTSGDCSSSSQPWTFQSKGNEGGKDRGQRCRHVAVLTGLQK